MKIEVVASKFPPLKPGQLWKNVDTGQVYLAIKAGASRYIELLLTETFSNRWADNGFGYGKPEEGGWEYLGELKVTP